jgi:hypothetical protein
MLFYQRILWRPQDYASYKFQIPILKFLNIYASLAFRKSLFTPFRNCRCRIQWRYPRIRRASKCMDTMLSVHTTQPSSKKKLLSDPTPTVTDRSESALISCWLDISQKPYSRFKEGENVIAQWQVASSPPTSQLNPIPIDPYDIFRKNRTGAILTWHHTRG